tara:strand:- start:1187 stop:1816 length:630 start_codon:yes stop_codon:yes gene_type:complete
MFLLNNFFLYNKKLGESSSKIIMNSNFLNNSVFLKDDDKYLIENYDIKDRINYKKYIFSDKFYNKNKNKDNDNNFYINNFTRNNLLKKIYNEALYLVNKRIKVYIHLDQLISRTNIYHIGISFNSILTNIRYDIIGIHLNKFYSTNNNTKSKTIFWDYSNKTIKDVKFYEKNMNYTYILGIYDCRHYVRNITSWACDNPTPVWELYKFF